MEVQIRKIDKKDYPDIVTLRNNELGGNVTLEEMALKMDVMKENEHYETFVAVYDGRVAGFISTVIVLAIEWPVGYLRVEGFAVDKSIQGKGIGSKLLDYAEEYAKSKGIGAACLNSNLKRADSHAFYEGRGYNKQSYFFVKKL